MVDTISTDRFDLTGIIRREKTTISKVPLIISIHKLIVWRM